MTQIGVRELRENLALVLRQAQMGETFIVMSHDEVLAEIRPAMVSARRFRQPGRLKGLVQIAPDFDALPEDVLDAMEE